MTEYVPPGVIIIRCECCKLPRRVRDRDGAEPRLCDECHQHQGELGDKPLIRARFHEDLLRERLAACRASEARAQATLDDAKRRVASALASRGALADDLVRAAEDGRRHDCAATRIARAPRVEEWASEHRERGGRWADE